MQKLTKVPNTSISTRRRSALPELSDIEHLIGQTRNLRLEFVRLTSFELLAESARSGADGLTQVGLALEKIAELLVSAKNRKRPHRKTLATPTFRLYTSPISSGSQCSRVLGI
jgi:hypothetical protein